jgi:hypothetical protein
MGVTGAGERVPDASAVKATLSNRTTGTAERAAMVASMWRLFGMRRSGEQQLL